MRVTLPHPGMTLRDYFAAKATDKDVEQVIYNCFVNREDPNEKPPTRQQARYMHADAMLAAREGGAA